MATRSYQTFSVPSSGRLGVVHTVTVFTDTGDTRCTCEDATYRRRQCRHQRRILATYTQAGRSGRLVETAQTAAAVQAEAALQAAEANGAPLGAILQQRADDRAFAYDAEADLNTIVHDIIQRGRW